MELKSGEISSIIYHNIFNYPLTPSELIKWKLKPQIKLKRKVAVLKKEDFYFLKGKGEIIEKRLQNKKYSKNKLIIARKAASVLKTIPTIKLVALTGALAMNNADKNSDIDLLIITKNKTLWTTRLITYLVLLIYGIKVRKPKDDDQKDKLCLNMWLDENDLVWSKKDRNMYSAHEIGQIVPLINRDEIYERLLNQNIWILDYWPNIVNIKNNFKIKTKKKTSSYLTVEKMAFKFQYMYMKNKISREVITPTRAVFHPNDWGKVVISRLTP